jgi:hypothetical protein
MKVPSPAPISAIVRGVRAPRACASVRATNASFIMSALMRCRSRRERVARGSSGGNSSSHSGSTQRKAFIAADMCGLPSIA